jgi:hypothetical protein
VTNAEVTAPASCFGHNGAVTNHDASSDDQTPWVPDRRTITWLICEYAPSIDLPGIIRQDVVMRQETEDDHSEESMWRYAADSVLEALYYRHAPTLPPTDVD